VAVTVVHDVVADLVLSAGAGRILTSGVLKTSEVFLFVNFPPTKVFRNPSSEFPDCSVELFLCSLQKIKEEDYPKKAIAHAKSRSLQMVKQNT